MVGEITRLGKQQVGLEYLQRDRDRGKKWSKQVANVLFLESRTLDKWFKVWLVNGVF